MDDKWQQLGFDSRVLDYRGGELFARVGGRGDAPVLLIHGLGQCNDMWLPLAKRLADHVKVVVVDLPGIGRSPCGEFSGEKVDAAKRVFESIDRLRLGPVHIVGHDLGGMVGYAMAATDEDRVASLALCESPLPGIDPWDQILSMPAAWHFHAHDDDSRRLIEGRERIYFDRLWNAFAVDPGRIGDSLRDHFASQYRDSNQLSSLLRYLASFGKDAETNQSLLDQTLAIPVIGIGGEHSMAAVMDAVVAQVARCPRSASVPGVGHWLIEEAPHAFANVIENFLEGSGLELNHTSGPETAVNEKSEAQ